MKKIALTLTLLVALSGYLHAQNIDLYHDTKVYRDLLTQVEQLETSEHVTGVRNLPVYFETSKKLLEEPWFPVNHKPVKLWNVLNKTDKDLEPLIEKIGVAKLKDQKLVGPIGLHKITKVHFSFDGNKPATAFLTLSPLLYSDDKTLAVCVISAWFGLEDSAETAYILELRNGSWILIQSQLLGFE